MRILFGWWLAASACLAMATTPAPDDIRVLFIGNSLTSVNEVPRLVELLSTDTDRPIRASAVTRNNFSLDDHLIDGAAAQAIARGGWTFVVLQQGPSALPESQQALRAAARQFNARIRNVGARPAFYMVWPAAARRQDFDGVRASYAAAARDVDGLLLPVADAWLAAWSRDPAIELYGADGFHPTPQASYLAALVITQGLTGRLATTLPVRVAGWADRLLPPTRARVLQEAAAASFRAAAARGYTPAGARVY